MKTMKTIMAGILVTSTLFTACRKDNSMMVDPNASNTPAARTTPTSRQLSFGTATMQTSYAALESDGKYLYQNTDMRKTDLYSSVMNTFSVRPTNYKNLSLTMDAAPLDEIPSLSLGGNLIREDGTVIPVEFSINKPVMFRAYFPYFEMNDAISFLNVMTIKPDGLTYGITDDMLQRAEMDAERMVISETRNVELYDLIVHNLSMMTHMKFGAPTPAPVPAPTAANMDPGPLR